jgi:hypothetical protein
MVHAIFLLIGLPVDFFSRSSKSRKYDMAKRMGLFDIRNVPESKKHAKTRKSASQC